MPLFDLSIITGIILESGVDVTKKKLNRQEAVVSVLKRLNIESAPAADLPRKIYPSKMRVERPKKEQLSDETTKTRTNRNLASPS